MALLFDITVPTNTLMLDAKRSGQITFTVASTSPRSLKALAQVSPSDPGMASWFQLEPGYARRVLDPHQTVQYLVTVQVPPTAPPKDYSFHLIIAEESNPDDNFSNSPDVKFSVPALIAPVPKKPFPWWIIALIAALVVVVVVGVAVAVTVTNNNNANATATVQANSATRTAEFLAQQGATQTAEFLIQQGATQTAQFLNGQAATATSQFLQTKTAEFFATQTQQARPTATFTPRPPATITVSNSGGFFAFFSVSYNLPGGFQSQTTSQFGAGSSQSITVPGDATGISVQIQVNTGFGNRNACDAISLSSPQNRNFNVSGTTFNSSCSG